jgi:hypothetical protein
MSWIKYKGNAWKSKRWKYLKDKIEKELKFVRIQDENQKQNPSTKIVVDIYAIDCIKLKSSKRMIGLWSPFKDKHILEEIIEEGLDNYPSWDKYKNHPELREELKEEVKKKLLQLKDQYHHIFSVMNVKVYYNCLEELSKEFNIILLPRHVDWKKTFSIFYQGVDEFANELRKFV